jgi:putative CocE/NonD family hydrolase
VTRTVTARVVDRLLGRALGLPSATAGYTVERDVRVPMRDGVELLADHYVPAGPVRGTLLVRSPYGRAGLSALLCARPYAERGYRVLAVSCRGTHGSGGQISAFKGEVEDGADTVAWLRAQPWFTGSFATLGVSYLGLTQWALLTDPPPEMKAAVIVSGPHDTGRLLYGSGALNLVSATGWTHVMLHQEERGPVASLVRGLVERDKPYQHVLDAVPVSAAARGAFGDRAPWYDEWLAHTDPADPFWDAARVTEALERTEVPVLLVSGWQDLILEQTLEAYQALHRRDVDVSLLVGPWNHGELASKGAGVIARETLGWLAEHLAGDGKRLSPSPVRIVVTGTDAWRDLAEWPPPTRPMTLFLQPGGGLGPDQPEAAAAPSTFTYDPSDPTPTVGGMTNALTAGRRDNSKHETRPDVLTFTGPVLQQPVEVLGSPVVELVHGSDTPHVDVYVRLCEVDAKGRSWNVSERYARLRDSSDVLRLELSPTAHCFRPGTRIRLQVSGGSHPMHDRNLGTGELAATGAAMRPAVHTISHGEGGVSSLVLPVS